MSHVAHGMIAPHNVPLSAIDSKKLPQAGSDYFWSGKKAVITITPKSDGLRKISDLQGLTCQKNGFDGIELAAVGGGFMKTRLMQLYPGLPRSLHTGAALVLCSTFLACIGATPLPKRTRTPEGTEVKSVDLTFIHPGQTTRDEVRQKLKIIDTGYEGDHFFLGRWSSSTWGGWMVAVGMPPGGFGGGGRVWKSGNLLVEFDDAGVVKRSEPFDDRKSIRVLTPVAANTPLHLTPPLELDLKFWETVGVGIVSAKIVLSPGRLDFEELGDRKNKYKFSLPAKDVLRVETPITAANTDPTYSGYRLRCAHDLKKVGGPHSRDINLALTLPQIVTLMTYVSQAKSAPDSAASATNGK